ncbi:hypothetical protein PRIPAC_82825 [Pristionchus pacificus]|uniref:G protein-coupled receptor n=1 Tax=Pristionchus pacificus TaxID=54126 RepID=A0A2A6C435_PRIPA|nr:hypothetical protein PRIPAC_82825 [Pristionchus pacificus]|eukprot:PDM72781.1 G protein-coupled receptor [Pristionchus pacificus]
MAGVILNISLLILLCRKDIGRAARLYRISCMITALLGLYTSFLLLLLQDVVILVDDCLAVVLYGSLLFYLPNRVIDHLAVAFFTQVHTMWQTISAPSVVQWMTLAHPNSSSARKLLYAYSIPALFYINTWYYMYYIIPDRSLKTKLVSSIYKLHGTNLKDFHIYGFRMIDDKPGDLRDIMLYEAVPSYLASYGLFILSALQIRIRLRRFGNVSSSRTTMMQRRFFRIQIAQVLLPLIMLSPPFCIALIAALNGVNFANLSFILVYTLWLSPSATVCVL